MLLNTLLQSQMQDFDPSIAEEFGYAATHGATFLGIPLVDTNGLLLLLFRFFFNLIVSYIVVRCFYYRKSGRRDYFLTFMLFSSAMFLLLFLMESVSLQIGFTLGLFAIFGMIRYRTETVPVREMTYLFIIIALSVINGIALEVSMAQLILANVLVIGLIWACEAVKLSHTSTKVVLYDRVDNITPDKRDELKADLEKRLGLKIDNVEVGTVDFLKDSCYVKIFYKLGKDETNSIDNAIKIKTYEH